MDAMSKVLRDLSTAQQWLAGNPDGPRRRNVIQLMEAEDEHAYQVCG